MHVLLFSCKNNCRIYRNGFTSRRAILGFCAKINDIRVIRTFFSGCTLRTSNKDDSKRKKKYKKQGKINDITGWSKYFYGYIWVFTLVTTEESLLQSSKGRVACRCVHKLWVYTSHVIHDVWKFKENAGVFMKKFLDM